LEPLILSDRFTLALEYAARVHRDQMRKKTSIPYISHLMAVAGIVLEHGGDEDEAIAALLHDAPEDQGGRPTLDDIRKRFGEKVASIVEACSDALTEDPNQKPPWRQRKAAYHAHLRQVADGSVQLVSAADKLHNARATLSDLRRHGSNVWERFNGKREGSLWNYEELLKAYALSSDQRVAQVADELRHVVEELSQY
jgi:(p)ppGpp synthase/HD superfamily hydrolase